MKSVGQLVSILHRQYQIFVNNALEDLNIGSSEYQFLVLACREEGLIQEQISERLVIDKAATARALCSLEGKGYIYRVEAECDHRKKKVYPTEAGKACLPIIRSRLNNWTNMVMEELDSDDIKTVTDSLEIMTTRAFALNHIISCDEEKGKKP